MAKFPIPTLRSAASDIAPTPLPPIDLNRLANEIAKKPPEVVAYAPPSQRPDAIDRTIEQVHMFGDLPTKELDDIILAAENEIAALKADAQAIRDMYVKHTERVVNDVKRLQSEVKLSMQLMHELRTQCGLLDANAAALTDRETEADTVRDLNRDR